MPNWTPEQNEAINQESGNIIVSAGAGSGKTAVLTERVIRKLKSGVDINHLLILTFTKKAASEMMERIRDKILADSSLKEQLYLLPSAYITTFDSLSLSILKKYHYLLNINKDVNITEPSIITLKKKSIINEIFEEYYQNNNPLFIKLIKDFTYKKDDEIKQNILNIYNKISLFIKKDEYLNNYLKENYQDSKIDLDIQEYIHLINQSIKHLKEQVESLSYHVDSTYYQKFFNVLEPIINNQSYESLYLNINNIKLPPLRNATEEAKEIKEKITNNIKKIKSGLSFSSINEMKSSIYQTEDYAKIIIDIIKELDIRLSNYKRQYDAYEFTDIALMAIKIIEDNPHIKDDLKHYFNEIMIDEYQDTSDIQEYFIKLIQNNNLYMVGDIKQSIYRFRNANPYIFKKTYEDYQNHQNGRKIDLNKNFRTRKESIDDINIIFNKIMDNYYGGADYQKNHQLIFGNQTYEKEATLTNQHLEILTYNEEDNYSKEELEAFIIVEDILNKINSGYQVLDKKTGNLRKTNYNDFCILVDRTRDFILFKKIFEYHNVPLNIVADNSLIDENCVMLFNNILKLIILTKKNIYDQTYQKAFMSVGRSFLLNYQDDYLFDIITNKKYYQTTLYQTIKELTEYLDSKSIPVLLEYITQKFSYYNQLTTIGNINDNISKLEYLFSLADTLSKQEYTIEQFQLFLDELIDNNLDIKYHTTENSINAVNIMTIHKSKGLEYPICYYAGLYNKFNIMELKEKFMLYHNFIVTPYIKENLNHTIYKELLKKEYLEEEISEKIRLFYVALTRSREKIIMLIPNIKDVKEYHEDERENYRSFYDIIKSIYYELEPFIKLISVNNLTKDYKKNNLKQYLSNISNSIDYHSINIPNIINEETSFSKKINHLIENNEKDKLELGNKVHQLLERLDFKNPDYSNIDSYLKEKINKFLNESFLTNIKSAKIIKEHEFMYEDNHQVHHGIIDLVVEYPDKLVVVDYKLKNIYDEAYQEQVKGYLKYLKMKTNKKIESYLYSIINNEYLKIDDNQDNNKKDINI